MPSVAMADGPDIPERDTITREYLETKEQLSPGNSPHIYKINDRILVKRLNGTRTTEATTMKYVRANTSVPVPQIYDVFTRNEVHGDLVYIVMEYVAGETLDKAWENAGEEVRHALCTRLKTIMEELHAIKSTWIGSVDESPCEDQFFEDHANSGPFQSEVDFKEALGRAVLSKGDGAWHAHVADFVRSLPSTALVLSHGDLNPRNILVKDGKIVAIVDWELAGFFPVYWDYVKAYLWSDWESPWIAEGIVKRCLKQYPQELALLLHARDTFF